VSLDGVFEAETTHEIILQPKAWSTLKVEKVIAEGTRVKKGEPILWLDTQQLDEQIQDQEFAQRLGYLSRKQAEVDLEVLEESVPLDLVAAQRSNRIAEEDWEYFREVTEAERKRSAEENLKSANYSLEYSQEELDQLEQMYKEDDLTEQTEEIILKRAQRSVERSQYYLELAKTRHEKALAVDLPREKQRVKDSAIRSELSLKKAEATLPRSLEKQRIELEKLLFTQEKLEQKLSQLRDDRDQMVVKAPADGFVYYGQSDRGKWTTAATLRKQLRPGGSLSANAVVMTVVADGPGFVRVDVPEKDFRHFTRKTPATVKPTAFPNTSFEGECGQLGPVAVKEGTFDGRVHFEWEKGDPRPVVGMTCKVTVTPYQKDDALTVPSSAVFGTEGNKHVFLKDGEESTKRPVTTGESAGGKTEITDGLSEGDVILLKKP
jgi:multidrug efflux pump subunit AcrA (membrane-fusion protein)